MGNSVMDMGEISLSLPSMVVKYVSQTSKALLVRKHPLAMTFAERLYGLLKDKEIGWEGAKALGDIVDSDAILTKDNHANVKVMRLFVTNSIANRDQSKILHVQKYVSTILPKLVALARTGSGEDGDIRPILHH
jgi:DNA repair/transcription protein MET18/MMS19